MDIVKEVSKYVEGIDSFLGGEIRSKSDKRYHVVIEGGALLLFEMYNYTGSFTFYTPIVYKTEEEILYLKMSTGYDWWVTHEQFMDTLISLKEA
jgi:hypothetical protein